MKIKRSLRYGKSVFIFSAHDKKTKKELVIPAQAGIQGKFIVAKPFLDPSLRWDDRDFLFFVVCRDYFKAQTDCLGAVLITCYISLYNYYKNLQFLRSSFMLKKTLHLFAKI